MLKEIFEQPQVFQKTIAGRIHEGRVQFNEFRLTAEEVQRWKKIYIVACGTAYHAGLVGKQIIEKLARIPVEVEIASEFRYRDPMLDEDTLVIVISQSGETADTVAALREAKPRAAKSWPSPMWWAAPLLGSRIMWFISGPVRNFGGLYQSLHHHADCRVSVGRVSGPAKRGVGDAVQLAAILEGLQQLPEATAKMLTDEYLQQIQQAAEGYKAVNDIFFIGRGLDWAIALEGSLKLKRDFLYSCRSLCGRGTKAWHLSTGNRRNAGYRHLCAGKHL